MLLLAGSHWSTAFWDLEITITEGRTREIRRFCAALDLVVEYDDGRVVAFEVKASERASGKEFRGLAQLRDLLGERFVGGIMLTTGTRSYTYEDRLHVMPIDRLWTPVPV